MWSLVRYNLLDSRRTCTEEKILENYDNIINKDKESVYYLQIKLKQMYENIFIII